VVFDVLVAMVAPHTSLNQEPAVRIKDIGGAKSDTRRAGQVRAAARARIARRTPRRRTCDRQLAQLAGLGDEGAFEELMQRHRPLLLAHCRAVAGQAGAQDAYQQTLINAWHALLRGAAVREPRAWLFTIAHRAALQVLREQGTRTAELAELLPGERSPEEQAERSAELRLALAAVAELPPRERDALIWTSIQGHSGRDAARALGVSDLAVRQLVSRARSHARAAMRAVAFSPFISRVVAIGGDSLRRTVSAAQQGLASASPAEASELLARLAPVLATGVLVGTPLAAVELGQHRGAHAPARLTPASRQATPIIGGRGARVSATGAARRGPLTARAPGRQVGPNARTGIPSPSRADSLSTSVDARHHASAPATGPQGQAGGASADSTQAALPVGSLPGGGVTPSGTPGRPDAARAVKALAPVAAAAEGASNSSLPFTPPPQAGNPGAAVGVAPPLQQLEIPPR
jgi:RNA polymerase sigma-70 factor (ECF subfamily)